MTDKERVLLKLVQLMGLYGRFDDCHSFKVKSFGDPKPGDLVICSTGRGEPHRWTVGYWVERIGGSSGVVREIGTDALCHVTNESFRVVEGAGEEVEFDRLRWKAYKKVLSALRRGRAYGHGVCFHSMIFEGRVATVSLREKWKQEISQTFRIKFYARTTVREVHSILTGGSGSFAS